MEESTLEGLIVGRIVHYQAGQWQCWAAIVTRVHDPKQAGIVDLMIFPPGYPGDPEVRVHYDQDTEVQGTWHWADHS